MTSLFVQVNWDVKEMQDVPNEYVSFLVEDVVAFQSKLEAAPFVLPPEAKSVINEQVRLFRC